MRKAVLVLAFVLTAAFAHAESITVGHLQVPNRDEARIQLTSPTFLFTGGALPLFGAFGPMSCMLAECYSGSELDMSATWIGMDLWGDVARHGDIIRVGSADSPQMHASWVASMLIPIGFGGGMLSAPFEFEGSYSDGSNAVFNLFGRGTVSAEFNRLPSGSLQLASANYLFTGDMTPNPEPATMLLLASGLAGLAYRRRQLTSRRN